MFLIPMLTFLQYPKLTKLHAWLDNTCQTICTLASRCDSVYVCVYLPGDTNTRTPAVTCPYLTYCP